MRGIRLLLVTLAWIWMTVGCTADHPTDDREPGTLYNTNAVAVEALFARDGVASAVFSDQPFRRVGLMWDGSGDVVLEGRVADANGTWTRWRSIEATWSEETAHNGHLDTPGAFAFGFQLRTVGNARPTFLFAEGIEALGEHPEQAPGNLEPGGLASLEQALGPASLVNTRQDWSARSPRCNSGSHALERMTIHHTDSPLPDSLSPEARLRQVQNYHMDTKVWCDIGYHFLVDWNGQVWQGRNETTIGAHVLNHNTHNVGISFVGNYNNVDATDRQLDQCAELMAWLHSTYQIPLDRAHVYGHRDWVANDCPGHRVYAQLDDLIGRAGGAGGDSGGNGDDPGSDGDGNLDKGLLQGLAFVDQGQGSSNMSWRLPGARVSVSSGQTTQALADGYFAFVVTPGSYTVTVVADGYKTASRTCSVPVAGEVWCSVGLVAGDDPGGDPGSGNAGKGRIYGTVLPLHGSEGDQPYDNLFIAGATVWADTGERTTADENGFFELWVPPGRRYLDATASGHYYAGSDCDVRPSLAAGGEHKCDIWLAVGEDTSDTCCDAGDEEIPQQGCRTSGPVDRWPIGLAVLLLVGLACRRR